LTGDHYHVLPWVLRLPSYAAVARFHGKASWPQDAGQELAAVQTIVEHFSLTEVLPGLAQGDRLADIQAQVLYTRLAQAIGVPGELLRRSRGRLSPGVFAKTLLQETHRLLSLYDGSVTAIDPTPEHPVHTGQDPRLDQLSAAFTATFNSYVREELHFVTDVPSHTLNTTVSKAWDWRSGINAPQGFAGTADPLKTALSHNPSLYAFIAHGYYDLVTPYFSSVFVVHQMALDEAIQSHMVLKVYAGGHMFYTHAVAHEQLWRDVHGFFHRAIPGSVPPPNASSRP
jgi:carboxypeptidase C (cathepsin A)